MSDERPIGSNGTTKDAADLEAKVNEYRRHCLALALGSLLMMTFGLVALFFPFRSFCPGHRGFPFAYLEWTDNGPPFQYFYWWWLIVDCLLAAAATVLCWLLLKRMLVAKLRSRH